jgi:hypothetical protein
LDEDLPGIGLPPVPDHTPDPDLPAADSPLACTPDYEEANRAEERRKDAEKDKIMAQFNKNGPAYYNAEKRINEYIQQWLKAMCCGGKPPLFVTPRLDPLDIDVQLPKEATQPIEIEEK